MADVIETERRGLTKRSIKTFIEIPILLNMIAVNVAGAAVSNIIFYRTCLHSLNYTRAECKPFLSPIKSNETYKLEKDVQEYASFVITVKTVLEYIGPAVMSLFLGVWSDTYGRKPLIVWPLFGMSVTGILNVIFSMVEGLNPWWYIATSVPFSFTGGYIVMFTGAYCYVSDTSTIENTSLRMTMVDATTALGSFLGSLVSSYLILAIGNVYLLLLSATLNVLAYAFTNIWIVESLVGALQGGATRVLDLLLVKEMFRDCFKERPSHGRAQIILLIIVKVIAIIILYGTSILEYMYTREKLHWALQEYTVYSAVTTVVSFFGGFFGIMAVQRLFRIGDIPFSMICVLTAGGEFLIKCFATTSFYMYISSVVSMFKGLLGPLIRSYLSKTLPLEDIAKVFALMCTFESIGPIISPLIYNSLYAVTVATYPGAIYLLSSGLSFGSAVLLGCVIYFSRSRTSLSTYERLESQEGDHIADA